VDTFCFSEIVPNQKVLREDLDTILQKGGKDERLKISESIPDSRKFSIAQKFFDFEISPDPFIHIKNFLEIFKKLEKFRFIKEIDFKPEKGKFYFLGRMTEIKYGYRRRTAEGTKGTKEAMGEVYGNFEDSTSFILLVFPQKIYIEKKMLIENLQDKEILLKANTYGTGSTLLAEDVWLLDDILSLKEYPFEVKPIKVIKDFRKIEEIEKEKMECTLCKSRELCNGPVPMKRGEINIMIIGEAPGVTEDLTKIPFTGKAGKVLFSALNEIGIEKEDLFVTNTVSCKPAGNKLTAESLKKCSWLEKEIRAVEPSLILSLGNTPLTFFTGEESGIMERNATVVWNDNFCSWIIYSIHPAAVLYHIEEQKLLDKSIKVFGDCLKKFLEKKSEKNRKESCSF